MDQAFIIANLDKGEYLDPLSVGDGCKLGEVLANGTSLRLLAVLCAVAKDGRAELHSDNPIIGRWEGDRIALTGDYGPEGEHLPEGWEEKWAEQEVDWKPNLWCWLGHYGVNMTGSALCALHDSPFMARKFPVSPQMMADAREAHSKLLASGYFMGKRLDSDDLSAFDLSNGTEEI